MRITNNIKEYVENEVFKRLTEKYHDELEEARKKEDILRNLNYSIEEEMRQLRERRIKEMIQKYDFLHDNRWEDECENTPNDYNTLTNECIDGNYSSVRNKIYIEGNEIVKKIIVELELGGNKEALMKMLDEIK